MKAWIMIILLTNGGCVEDVAEATDIEAAKEQVRALYPDGRIIGCTQIA